MGAQLQSIVLWHQLVFGPTFDHTLILKSDIIPMSNDEYYPDTPDSWIKFYSTLTLQNTLPSMKASASSVLTSIHFLLS